MTDRETYLKKFFKFLQFCSREKLP